MFVFKNKGILIYSLIRYYVVGNKLVLEGLLVYCFVVVRIVKFIEIRVEQQSLEIRLGVKLVMLLV